MAKKIEAPKTTPADNGQIVNLDATTVEKHTLPQLPINDPFYLCAHPRRWKVEYDSKGKPYLIPDFGVLVYKLGVENCSTETKAEGAKAGWRKRGWTVIPHSAGYLRAIDTEPRPGLVGKHHLTPWDRVFPGSSRKLLHVDAFAAWCDQLVSSGQIEGPDVSTLQTMLSDLQALHAKHTERARTSSGFSALLS